MSILIDSSRFVLVVEDEPIIRDFAMEIVIDAGFLALGAATADEALALLRRESRVCIVLTDVDMPGSMNGLGLARSIHDLWPSIRLIVTSGRRLPEAQMPRDPFLPKPYRSQTLRDTLHALAA